MMKVVDSFAEAGGLLTVNEFCNWASIGRTKLYAEMNAGRLMAKKLGSRTLIPRAEAQKWLEQLPTKH